MQSVPPQQLYPVDGNSKLENSSLNLRDLGIGEMPVMEGPLSKWTNVMQGWQYRWFVLDEYNGVLFYYTSKEKMLKGQRRGCVRLKDAIIGIDSEDDSTFTVKVDHKTFHFQARDADEREQWTRALEVVIRLQNRGPQSSLTQRYHPNLPEFEKRLTESDAYLKILLDQIKNLKAKRDQLKGSGRVKLDAIISSAEQMSEYVKHALIILQIAKNECQNPTLDLDTKGIGLNVSRLSDSGESDVVCGGNEEKTGEDLKNNTEKNRRISKLQQKNDQRSTDSDDSRLSRLLPWTSYSSDDEFYDAEDTFDHMKPHNSGSL